MKYTINNRPALLQRGDEVVFELKNETLRYEAKETFLNLQERSNDRVFHLLGVNRIAMADGAYGYQNRGGDWPMSRGGDFEALTRLVNAIFEKIAEIEKEDRKFKVGDRVRQESTRWIGKVVEEDEDDLPYLVRFDDAGEEWCSADELTLLPLGENEEGPRTYTIENRPTLLREDDKVVFVVSGKEMKHTVTRDRLTYFEGMDREIFDRLDIDDRFEFATKIYGYESGDMCFPEWKTGDYEAATKLVNALFDEIAKREKKDDPAPRFKVGDHVDHATVEKFKNAVVVGLVKRADGMAYQVKWPTGMVATDPESHLVPAASAPEEVPTPDPIVRKFKPGDPVRVVKATQTPIGTRGVVIGDSDSGGVDVRWNGGLGIRWAHPEAIELISQDELRREPIDEVLQGIPEGFRSQVRELLAQLPKARTLVFGIVARDGEIFEGAGTSAIYCSTFDEGANVFDHVGLARLIQIQADSRIVEERHS